MIELYIFNQEPLSTEQKRYLSVRGDTTLCTRSKMLFDPVALFGPTIRTVVYVVPARRQQDCVDAESYKIGHTR